MKRRKAEAVQVWRPRRSCRGEWVPWDKWAFWFLLLLGAAELALGQSPIARRRRAAFVILSTLGVALLVAAFPFRYSGEHLSVLWLMEAEAIL